MRAHTYRLMFAHQKGLCCYCETPMISKHVVPVKDLAKPPRNMATDEHLRRKADGGGNDMGNRRLACVDCNEGRGNIDWLTYKSYRMGENIVVA